MKKELKMRDELTEFLLYTAPNGDIKVEVYLNDENLWLSQERIAELFRVDRSVVTKHIENIYNDKELLEDSTCAILAQVRLEGKREIKYYNLDMIIAVGYRVDSLQATHFRIWATNTVKEYIIKGFAMDDNRLKHGHYFSKNYFKELLERVRSIRTSERRIYLQITDILAVSYTFIIVNLH